MIYAISDIHGCYKTLQVLLQKLEYKPSEDRCFFLGDYIDRGPSSKAVLDFLIDLKQHNNRLTILRGNHEQMMLDTFKNNRKEDYLLWKQNGCETTLQNFGVPPGDYDLIEHIPSTYIDFIESLPYFAEYDQFLLAHAGFNFQSGDPFNDTNSMLWIRDEDYDKTLSEGKTIIHGHTQRPVFQILKKINNKSNVICIDSGCVYKKVLDLGWLSALNLETFELISVKNIDF